MYFYCEKCKKEYPISSHFYRCECGGMFRLHKEAAEPLETPITLGDFPTPLLPIEAEGKDFILKLENLLPTGSFKDRGAKTLINAIHRDGIKKIALDSAGNAGASIAAYAAAAGMECTVYVPDDASLETIAQIEGYGAKIVKVPNGRMNACTAVKANLGDAYYASHVYNPLFFEGMKAMAKEMTDQLDGHIPDYIFIPVGNGTLLIGLFLGFMELGRLPHFVAVQPSKCAPVYEAYHGLDPQPKKQTIAQALRIEEPKRLSFILSAIKASFGDVITVEDKDILSAKQRLGHRGVYVELSSAAAFAGALKYFKNGKPDNYRVILPMTGNGLKR